MLKCNDFSRPNFSPAAFAVRRCRSPDRAERNPGTSCRMGGAKRYPSSFLQGPWWVSLRSTDPTKNKKKGSGPPADALRSNADRSERPVRKRRTGRAADKAACAALPLRARSPAGVPPRFCPRGVWSLGAIRARLRGCFATAADMTAGSAPTSSGAPRTPVIVPAGLMPGPPGSRLMRPARGLRTRPLPPGITRTASFMGRVSPYVSMNRTDVNGGVTKKFARVPGAARVRCRPGIVKSATPAKVPDQRCTTTARRRRA